MSKYTAEMNNEPLIRLRNELELELRDNILPYWMKYLPDRERGGFHGHVTHLNQVVEDAPTGESRVTP